MRRWLGAAGVSRGWVRSEAVLFLLPGEAELCVGKQLWKGILAPRWVCSWSLGLFDFLRWAVAPGLLQGWLRGFVLTRAAPGRVSRLCPSGAEQALIHPQPLNHPGPAAAPFPKSNLGSDGSSWARPGEAGAGGSRGCGVSPDPARTQGWYRRPPLLAARAVMVVQTQPTKRSRNPHRGGGSETKSPHPAVRQWPKGSQISCNFG